MNKTDNKYFLDEKNASLQSLHDKKYAEAMSHLRSAAKIESGIDRDAEALEAQFFYMLRFLAANNSMPDMATALEDIEKQFVVLTQRIELEEERQNGTSLHSGVLRYAAMRPEETLESLFSDYLAELARLSTDTAALTDTRRRCALERLANDIFNRLWTAFPLSDDSQSLVESMFTDDSIPQHDRELWIAALGLNYADHATENVATILLAINAGSNPRLSTLAAVWLTLGYNDDSLGRHVLGALEKNNSTDLPDVVGEWCRSLARTAAAKKGKGNSLDRLNRLGRDFMNRMHNTGDGNIEEHLTDPEWINSHLDSNDYDAIRQFASEQSKGEDVFAGTLGKMRHFDFFNTLSNWFLPFHTAHSALAPVVDGEGAVLADTISAMPVLCDSDKYAMLLSMAQMPSSIAGDSLAAMSQQMMSLTDTDEFADIRRAAGEQSRRALINNEIKNIYRFYMLHSRRSEFRNTLGTPPHKSILSLMAKSAPERAGYIADMLLAAEYYHEAVSVYQLISESLSAEQLFNYGSAAELGGNTSLAEEIYCELVKNNPGDIRAVLRLAALPFGEDETASRLHLLGYAAEANPDNVDVLRAYAHSLAISGQWEKATDVYHNINYLQPDSDTKSKTDLAWALTVTGDYESAEVLFEATGADENTLAKKAVMQWLAGRHDDAIATETAAQSQQSQEKKHDSLFHKGCSYVLANATDNALSLPMLYEIVHYRRYGSQFGTI